MEEEARKARLLAVFENLSVNNQDLVLRMIEAIQGDGHMTALGHLRELPHLGTGKQDFLTKM